jgi:putative membrane protein insertion efficiency factor
MGLLRLYQLTLASVLGGRCRFTPSCSAYAIEALRRHGARHGGRLAIWRVLRCSPMCSGGHDPVPEPRLARRVCDAPKAPPALSR